MPKKMHAPYPAEYRKRMVDLVGAGTDAGGTRPARGASRGTPRRARPRAGGAQVPGDQRGERFPRFAFAETWERRPRLTRVVLRAREGDSDIGSNEEDQRVGACARGIIVDAVAALNVAVTYSNLRMFRSPLSRSTSRTGFRCPASRRPKSQRGRPSRHS